MAAAIATPAQPIIDYFAKMQNHDLRMRAAGNFGIYLEEQMLYAFRSMGIFCNIQHENDLRKKYGFDAASIDYMLEIPQGYIVAQIKWRATRRRENNGVNNFLKSVDFIRTKLPDKPILFGVWACRMEPFEDNKETLRKNNIAIVSNYSDMESLVQQTQMLLSQMISSGSESDDDSSATCL